MLPVTLNNSVPTRTDFTPWCDSWEASVAADVITDALKELSRRAGQRGDKVGE